VVESFIGELAWVETVAADCRKVADRAVTPAFGEAIFGSIHESRLEDRRHDGLQCLVHPPIQLDLVVQRAEDVGDGSLYRQ